jgi:hypothetical protein
MVYSESHTQAKFPEPHSFLSSRVKGIKTPAARLSRLWKEPSGSKVTDSIRLRVASLSQGEVNHKILILENYFGESFI